MPGLVAKTLSVLGWVAKVIEGMLFLLVSYYDAYIYSPLQTTLHPIMCMVPRYVIFNNKQFTVFTANIVSWARTTLVIPFAICLKNQWNTSAFLIILVHDFLDHVDGIVAKAQKQVYGQIDDPLLGGFMDAFCDKIVNVFSLWTILLISDYSSMCWRDTAIYVGACSIIIVYEFILGVVRVQDYFHSYYKRYYKKSDDVKLTVNITAVMEGKLKEKLESLGIAFLSLSQNSIAPLLSYWGMLGVMCLVLSVRLAHASLEHKLKARQNEDINTQRQHESDSMERYLSEPSYETKDANRREGHQQDIVHKLPNRSPSSSLNTGRSIPRTRSLRSLDGRMDRVYTVGCFDLFHYGHQKLMERMKTLGKEVIVGVHDSRSIFQLKKKVPIDNTETRMRNVKQYADIVFCVAGTDPTSFLSCIVNESDDKTCMYVRGDDMENFPAREFCEKVMKVTFLPYSQGISSTELRKKQPDSSRFGPHTNDDGHAIFY